MARFKLPDGIREPRSKTKSIRFPNEVIDAVEEAIRGTNCSFTAFVVEAVRVALKDLAEEAQE